MAEKDATPTLDGALSLVQSFGVPTGVAEVGAVKTGNQVPAHQPRIRGEWVLDVYIVVHANCLSQKGAPVPR